MPSTVPRDPLARFLAICDALATEKRWWEHRSILRFAAFPLVLADGEPAAVAARTTTAGQKLADDAGWFSGLGGSLRMVVAALAAGERDAARLASRCTAVRERFRNAGVRRGGAFEWIAAVMLCLAGADDDASVRRMQKIYDSMRTHHWWLTGADDLPACALLTVYGGDLASMSARIEALYQLLRAGSLRAGSGLQFASHLLYLADGSEQVLAQRFLALHHGFLDAGINMWDCDRDELALLCLLGEEPKTTIGQVIEHRAVIRARLRFVGATTSFSFACGTAFLAARAGRTLDERGHRDVTVANLALATNAALVLQQQQAAAASAAS